MARTLFVAVFLSLYIIVVGIPLLLWTVISRNPAALYWGGVKGVMFFVRSVGVKVKVSGLERIPSGACLFVANHTSSADAPAVVGAIPRRIAIPRTIRSPELHEHSNLRPLHPGCSRVRRPGDAAGPRARSPGASHGLPAHGDWWPRRGTGATSYRAIDPRLARAENLPCFGSFASSSR